LIGNISAKVISFLRQILLSYFLGISYTADIIFVSQVIPLILMSLIGGASIEIVISYSSKKDSKHIINALLIFLTLIGLILVYVFNRNINIWIKYFKIVPNSIGTFKELSLFFSICVIPNLIFNISNSVAFIKNKYTKTVIANVISQLIGIFSIILFYKKFGLIIFAISYLITQIIAMIFLIDVLELKKTFEYTFKNSLNVLYDVVQSIKSWSIISFQTLISKLAMFLDRSFSVRFLDAGYLSAFNYAQSVCDIPSLMISSTLGTTTYVEQSKLAKGDYDLFKRYSLKMFNVIFYLSIFIQNIILLFAPFIIMVLFRRGQFNNDAVIKALVPFELLSIAIVPTLLVTFLNRTLYVVGAFKESFLCNVFQVASKTLLLFFFINKIYHIIPLSSIICVNVSFILSLIFLFKIIRFINVNKVYIYILSNLVSVILMIVNKYLIQFYINLNNVNIILSFVFIFLILLFLIIMNKDKLIKYINVLLNPQS